MQQAINLWKRVETRISFLSTVICILYSVALMAVSFPELLTTIIGGAHFPPRSLMFMPVVFTILVVLVVWLFYKLLGPRTKNANESRLPPGPLAWPVIGNMHLLGELPHRALRDLAKKYGPIMFLRLGSAPTVVVSSSEMAKEFLKTHDLVFANRPESAASKYVAYNEKNVGLAPYGDYWRHMRKVCVMELLSAKRIESFRSVREEEVSLAVKAIWEKSKHGTVAVNVSKTIASLISSIIWRTLAGTKFSEDDDLVGKELNRMVHQVTSMIGAFNIGDFIPSIAWIDDLSGVKRKMKKAHNFFDKVVEKIIDEHLEERRRRGKQDQNGHTKDLVDVLLEMAENENDMKITREHIKATIFDMFLGGLETTINTLEWAMSEMVRNPRVAKKLQAEIESVAGKHRMVRESDLAGMDYLQCVVKEVFRLYPAGPLMLPHESRQDCTIAGYFIPQKTRLIVNVWAIGRDPAVWEDPLTFKPERFVGKNIDIKGRDFEMLPFGAGRRGCPGAGLAMGNIELVLAQLLHCFDWTLEGNGNPSEFDMTESFRTSIPRKDNLFAVPALKVLSAPIE